DTEAPSITCPADISVPESSSSSNAATVSYNTPTATDNSGTANVTCNPPSGSSFPVGTTQVVCTATDPSGNSASCSFDVTVTETACSLDASSAPPTPNAASLPTLTGECSAAITGDPPTATDNCAGSGIVGTPLDPLSYNTPGTHTVRWKFTDAAGNSTIQNQNVVVTDSAPPVPNV